MSLKKNLLTGKVENRFALTIIRFARFKRHLLYKNGEKDDESELLNKFSGKIVSIPAIVVNALRNFAMHKITIKFNNNIANIRENCR